MKLKINIPELSEKARCRRNLSMALLGAMAQLVTVAVKDMHMFFAVCFGLLSGWFIMWAVHEIERLIELHEGEMFESLALALKETQIETD